MIDFFYSLFLLPLELIYRHLYLFSLGLVKSYGMSLLFLSLVSTAFFSPLKHLAASLQEKEKRIRKVIDPQIAAIKSESHGAERQARISALYRRYAYSPFLAMRSSIGLLLQVPFLIAAYSMIESFEPIRGVAFGPIADLAKPDALLGGVNALPIVMTVFNLIAVAITPAFTKRDSTQAIIMAAAFLLMLYAAPSALLIYWTGNNALMVVETLWHRWGKRLIAPLYKIGRKRFKADYANQPSTPLSGLHDHVPLFPIIVAITLFTAFLALETFCSGRTLEFRLMLRGSIPSEPFTSTQFYLPPALYLIVFGLSLCCAAIVTAKSPTSSRRGKLTRWALMGLSLAAVAAVASPLAKGGVSVTQARQCLRLYDVINGVLVFFALLCLPWKKIGKVASTLYLSITQQGALYAGSIFLLGGLIAFFSPASIYQSEPEFFATTYASLLKIQLPYFFAWLLFCAMLWLLFPKKFQKGAAATVFCAALVALLNITLFPGDYGELDGLTLKKAENLFNWRLWMLDIPVLWISLILCTIIIAFHKIRQTIVVLGIASLICLSYSGMAVIFDKKHSLTKSALQTNESVPALPQYLSFSKTRPNVLIIVMDMFTGGHMEDILQKNPEIAESFPGFVWYPDTVAATSFTLGSMPGILGGEGFIPENRPSTKEKSIAWNTEASLMLPKLFAAAGYTSTLLESFFTDWDEQQLRNFPETPPRIILKPDPLISEAWLKKIGYSNQPAAAPLYMPEISIFTALPHREKKELYNRGVWRHGLADQYFTSRMREIIDQAAILGSLPELSTNNANAPTVQVIYNQLSHDTWHLVDGSLVPVNDPYPQTQGQNYRVDGVVPEHIMSERHVLSMLGSYFKWMRENDVYDNTRIIVVSDHCMGDSRMLNTALGGNDKGTWHSMDNNVYLGWPHALLMVKDLKTLSPFSVNNSLMSTEDVPSIATEGLLSDTPFPKPDTGPTRVRHHLAWGKKITVKGTMFSRENWSQLRK